MTDSDDIQYAKQQAKAQLDSIIEMLETLKSDDPTISDEAQEDIQNDPLSIEIRSCWLNPGAEFVPDEFKILLCTGGPAVRIIGELNQYNEPIDAILQYQNWFTAWMSYPTDTEESEALLKYTQQFWYGE